MSGVLIFLATMFAIGGVLIALAQLYPATRQAARDIWPLYGSEFIIVAGILVPAALGGWWLMAAALIFVWRGLFEIYRLFDEKIVATLPLAMILITLLLLPAIGNLSVLLPLTALIAGITLTVSALIDFRQLARKQIAATAIAIAYPLAAAGLTVALIGLPNGFLWLVFVYATVEINDAFALVFGKLFGRRRILPKLSPGKTEAGLIGGLLAGAVAGFCLAHWLLELPYEGAIVATLIALAAGLAGDLATSALKRARGKKDFPQVLKRHGGVLDIYDSLLFAAPAIVLWRLLA